MNKEERLLVLPGVGDRLRQERRRLGLSQERFGELAGLKRTVIGFFERGVAVPHTEYLATWAEHSLDVIYVLFGVRPEQLAAAVLSTELTERVFAQIDQFENDLGHTLDPKTRAKVFRMVLAANVSGQTQEVPFSEDVRWRKKVI